MSYANRKVEVAVSDNVGNIYVSAAFSWQQLPNVSKVQVKEFHQVFGHPIADKPDVSNYDLRLLRCKLILEEAVEFVKAAGFQVSLINRYVGPNQDQLEQELMLHPVQEPNMVEMADALADLDYVTQGANLAFGFPSEHIMLEVHASNMSKLGADGKPVYREDGKVLKGPGYFKPQIEEILKMYINAGRMEDGTYGGQIGGI